MGKTAADMYETWDLSPAPMPTRNTLYALEPIGVGTPFVESLTSYLARLAEAHCVFPGTLLQKVLVPQLATLFPQKSRKALVRECEDRSHAINAAGLHAQRMLVALETLTGLHDLRSLTLVMWANVLFGKGATRLQKAWCPVCYEAWRRQGRIVYDPLLWTLEAVTTCPWHRVALRLSCANVNCGRDLPSLAWRSRPGYCPYCQHWLGTPHAEKATRDKEERAWQAWVSESLGGLLALSPMMTVPLTRHQVRERLMRAVQKAPQENLKFLPGKAETLPRCEMWLCIGAALGLSPADILVRDEVVPSPEVMTLAVYPLNKRRPSIRQEKEQLAQVLEAIRASSEYPPLSLAAVARRLGCSATILSRCHREACQAISARYQAYLRQSRRERIASYREQIRRVALRLRAEGKPITKNHAAAYLDKPGVLRSPEMREALKKIRQQLEAE